jgi:hypothetical protein
VCAVDRKSGATTRKQMFRFKVNVSVESRTRPVCVCV